MSKSVYKSITYYHLLGYIAYLLYSYKSHVTVDTIGFKWVETKQTTTYDTQSLYTHTKTTITANAYAYLI